MYCRFCGKEIKDQAKFCGFCGNTQNPLQEAPEKKQPNILGCVFGLLFIFGGILPYLLQGGSEAYQAYNFYISSVTSRSDITYASAVCFQKFYNILPPLFYFSSSALSVYAGLLLIKGEPHIKRPLVFCFIVHILSVVYTGVVNLLVFCAPRSVVSLFTPSLSVMEAAEELIRAEPDLLYYYQDQAFRRLVISIVLIVLVVVFLSIHKRSAVSPVTDEKKSSCIGGILMILSLALLSIIGSILSASSTSAYGMDALSAYSTATQAFSLKISPAVIYIFMVLMALAVFFTRIKRWILTLPTAGVIGLLTLVVCLLAKSLLGDNDPPPSIFAMTLRYFRGFTVNNAAILMSIFCWFNALSRNRIPKWLQVALPVSVPVIYTAFQLIMGAIFRFRAGTSFGVLFISLLTIFLSLLVHIKESRLRE